MKSFVAECLLFGTLAIICGVHGVPEVTRLDNFQVINGNVSDEVKESGTAGNATTSSSKQEPGTSASDSIDSFQSLSSDDDLPEQFSIPIVTPASTPEYALPPGPADFVFTQPSRATDTPDYALPPGPADYKLAPPARATPVPIQSAPPPPITPLGFGGFSGGLDGGPGVGFGAPGVGLGAPGIGGPGIGFGLPGLGGGVGVSVGGYFPVVEKLLVIFGGGILLLIMLALFQGSLASGGVLNNFGSAISKSFSASGSDHIDVGPFHKSGFANVNANKNVNLSHQVNQAVNHKF